MHCNTKTACQLHHTRHVRNGQNYSILFVVTPIFPLFSLTAVEDRKDWLRGFKTGTHADYNVESVTYESFINKELILFSVGIFTPDTCS